MSEQNYSPSTNTSGPGWSYYPSEPARRHTNNYNRPFHGLSSSPNYYNSTYYIENILPQANPGTNIHQRSYSQGLGGQRLETTCPIGPFAGGPFSKNPNQ